MRNSNIVAHTLDVLYTSERVMAITSKVELGQRGYSLTDNDEFLVTFNSGKNEIDAYINNLETLTKDNAIQQKRIGQLKNNIKELIKFSSKAIITKQKEGFDRTRELNSSLTGKRLMDTIRTIIGKIENEEHHLLKTRNDANTKLMAKSNYTFIALLVTTGLIIVTIFAAINSSLRARMDMEAKLKIALADIRDLYDHAPCGYHSIDPEGYFVEMNTTLLKWLGYQSDEIIKKKKFTDIISKASLPVFEENFEQFKKTGSVHNLEFCFIRKDGSEFPVVLNSVAVTDRAGNYVKSRTTTFDNTEQKRAGDKIRLLNQELEAFTYSVSHDLRAPLRSIDGYSRILQEDFSTKLDDEGKRVIHVIMSNAKRMGNLIDDLLDFARLGRKEALRTNLNMTSLVRSIAKDLREHESNREIEIDVKPLETAQVDGDMMRQVWTNLLSNAIKYTGKTSHAKIEIDSFRTEDEVCYRISDNGVGFDMQYASKLFGVFQRLHRMQDFSGTGVGLATVKRIIDHHNGRVWADGKLNGGASFYFSIPNNNGKQ